ncbi:hypothetical protein [Paradesulfitobacterium ferrireducens]|uniref:hypothetical protein n=1 Tax=Paradesulfitobacterium ferrireducens TaxID=2816476 RepID=UPI001A8FDC65|nr:hypothetical protein [Paradesulfitobacterium ferrireducens]
MCGGAGVCGGTTPGEDVEYLSRMFYNKRGKYIKSQDALTSRLVQLAAIGGT